VPAHRKDLEVHLMSGAAAKNPQRFTQRKPAPKPAAKLGLPPKHLTPDEKRAWKELASITPAGVLTIADRIAVEVCSRLLVRFRSGDLTKVSEIACLLSLLARFGMTPADRNKVQSEETVKPTQETDEWSSITKLRRPRNQVRESGSGWDDPRIEVDPPRVQ
jgi:hypothetical protein